MNGIILMICNSLQGKEKSINRIINELLCNWMEGE